MGDVHIGIANSTSTCFWFQFKNTLSLWASARLLFDTVLYVGSTVPPFTKIQSYRIV